MARIHDTAPTYTNTDREWARMHGIEMADMERPAHDVFRRFAAMAIEAVPDEDWKPGNEHHDDWERHVEAQPYNDQGVLTLTVVNINSGGIAGSEQHADNEYTTVVMLQNYLQTMRAFLQKTLG